MIYGGRLDEILLVTVTDGAKLHWLAAAAWKAMRQAALASGVDLRPSSAGDGYRTFDSQLRNFLKRYQLEPNGNPTRIYDGKTWYLKKTDPDTGTTPAQLGSPRFKLAQFWFGHRCQHRNSWGTSMVDRKLARLRIRMGTCSF